MSRTKQIDGGLLDAPGACAVGIDQSYSGFAITALSLDDPFRYHTWVHKADGSGVTRLRNIQYFLDETLDLIDASCKVSDSAIEGYAYGAQMAHMAGELGAVVKLSLQAVLSGTAQYPLIISPSMLKKYVVGKGTGVQKNQMLLHTFKTWGVEFSDDNACDSFGLAMIASGRAQFAYQKDVLSKLHDPKFREKTV
jgi:hypothetical protein